MRDATAVLLIQDVIVLIVEMPHRMLRSLHAWASVWSVADYGDVNLFR